jgi:hypothetical protein
MKAGVSAETAVVSATDERQECSLTVLHLDETEGLTRRSNAAHP